MVSAAPNREQGKNDEGERDGLNCATDENVKYKGCTACADVDNECDSGLPFEIESKRDAIHTDGRHVEFAQSEDVENVVIEENTEDVREDKKAVEGSQQLTTEKAVAISHAKMNVE